MNFSKLPTPVFPFCRSLMKIVCLIVFVGGLARADGVHPDPGHLQQTVLVILRFPPQGINGELAPTDETYVNSQLSIVSDFIWTNSNQSLLVTFQTVKILQSLTTTDYECYGPTGCTAPYDAVVEQSLASRLSDPRQYAGVVMIYRPTNAPSGGLFYNTWIYFNNQSSGPFIQPGLSSIFYAYNSQIPLSQYIEHEYCHQLHHRFEFEAKDIVPSVGGLNSFGFIDSDWMTTPNGTPGQLSTIAVDLGCLLGTTFQPNDDPAWLAAILKYYVGPADEKHRCGTLHAVNYRHLEGRYPNNIVLGVFDGGELKTTYDFARPDDALVHASGEDIAAVLQGPGPAQFDFRATPGHTAAFGTQTGFGLYLLKQVAFNYELLPGDYTFQVHLVYYDVRNQLVDVRIDDGVYVLGQGLFPSNRKVITLPVPLEVEDFQIVFQKGNQLGFGAVSDDWVRLGNISLDVSPAP
jgi:hypothetical protein